jgi:hypothetical protein
MTVASVNGGFGSVVSAAVHAVHMASGDPVHGQAHGWFSSMETADANFALADIGRESGLRA